MLPFANQLRQRQQVFRACNRPTLRLFPETVWRAGISPGRWQIGDLLIVGAITHPPLAPASSASDQFEPSATLRMKRVRDCEELF
jgi:hypothetical protein